MVALIWSLYLDEVEGFVNWISDSEGSILYSFSLRVGLEPGALRERLIEFDARSNPLGTTGGLGPGLLNVKSASLYSCNFSKE